MRVELTFFPRSYWSRREDQRLPLRSLVDDPYAQETELFDVAASVDISELPDELMLAVADVARVSGGENGYHARLRVGPLASLGDIMFGLPAAQRAVDTDLTFALASGSRKELALAFRKIHRALEPGRKLNGADKVSGPEKVGQYGLFD